MSQVTSPAKLLTSLTLVAISLAGFAAAAADSAPDAENGRYTFSNTADGLIRLDTRTGTVSTCSNSVNGWACYAVPDERKALDEEIGRLQAENDKLKAQLAAREASPSDKAQEPLPQPDRPVAPKAEGERKIEIPLPSDADVDRVMSFLERAWRRLVEMANRMQKDSSDKI
jgi:hypothetical protein